MRFVSLEIRRRQKAEYIEVIETPEILAILKHLFPVLQEPIMDLYKAGDLPKIITRTFAVMKRMIQIGEAKNMTQEEKLRRYREIVDEIQEMIYSFLHGMAKKDKGTLHLLADWLIGSWVNADHHFDLEGLLEGVRTFFLLFSCVVVVQLGAFSDIS